MPSPHYNQITKVTRFYIFESNRKKNTLIILYVWRYRDLEVFFFYSSTHWTYYDIIQTLLWFKKDASRPNCMLHFRSFVYKRKIKIDELNGLELFCRQFNIQVYMIKIPLMSISNFYLVIWTDFEIIWNTTLIGLFTRLTKYN